MTTTMRVAECVAFASEPLLQFRTTEAPQPKPDQILVEIAAVGLNFTDLLALEGRSQLKRNLPFVPGVECAGRICAVGANVTGWSIGQRVIGVKIGGLFAERAVFQPDELCAIPDEMDFASAAAFWIASRTSQYALVERAQLKAGEKLLVLGAGSGVGLTAVEIGVILGAEVVAAASSEEKLALAAKRGAAKLLLYPREIEGLPAQKALYEKLMAESGPADAKMSAGALSTLSRGAGYDVVYDAVGGNYTEPALRALAWQGRFLSIGFSAGVPAPSLGPLLFKNARLEGIQASSDELSLIGRNPDSVRMLMDWYRAGRLKPDISAVFPLEQANEALDVLKQRQAKGRLVLTVSNAEAKAAL